MRAGMGGIGVQVSPHACRSQSLRRFSRLHRTPWQIWRLESHGRRWLPVLEAASDARLSLGQLPANAVTLAARPTPHWQAGTPFQPAADHPAAPSVVVTRPKSHGGEPMTHLPSRYLRGLLPEALLGRYLFWQRADGSIRGERRGGDNELLLHLNTANEALVRRTPLRADGTPRSGEGRLLLTHLHSPPNTPLAKLVSLLARLDDIAHILLWAPPDGDGDTMVGGSAPLPLDLVELPRLHLSFRVVRDGGVARLASVEHPGLVATWAGASPRMIELLRGIPHALLLTSPEGGAHVLVPALAKPCMLSDTADPLSSGLLLATHDPRWSEALPATRHYIYAVHRSAAYLEPPSFAAAVYLLLLRWLARDYEGACALCACCSADTPLTAEDAQVPCPISSSPSASSSPSSPLLPSPPHPYLPHSLVPSFALPA